MSLNERQKAFCEYYAACFNATEAAIKAGYSEKTARSIGAENLTKPDIQNYLQTLTQKAQTSRVATIQEVLEYLSSTMRNQSEVTRERTKAAQILHEALSGKPDDSNKTTEIRVTFEDASGKEGEDDD